MTPLSPFETYFLANTVYAVRQNSRSSLQKEYAFGKFPGYEEHVSSPIVPETIETFQAQSGLNQSLLKFAFLTTSTGFGFLARRPNRLNKEYALVTRGTDIMPDWITDANIGVARGPNGKLVHNGFNDTFNSYRHQLEQLLAEVGPPPATIHCVGHSLGGALANLNAALLKARGYTVYLYTLGCPRVGHYPFASDLEQSLKGRIFRIANRFDPVAMIPVFPFMHAGLADDTYLISAGGKHLNFTAHSTDPTKAGYAVCLNKQHLTWDELKNTPLINPGFFNKSLEFQIEMLGGGLIYNAEMLMLIGQAIKKLVSKIGEAALVTTQRAFQGAVGAIDRLAEILMLSASMSVVAAEQARSIVSAIFKFMGRRLEQGVQLTISLLRWVLNQLISELNGLAKQAITRR